MFDTNTAIKVEKISKVYRIGIKEEAHDNFVETVFGFLKNPIKNYRKYRSLYKFDDLDVDANGQAGKSGANVIWALKDISFDVKKSDTSRYNR